MSNVVSRILCAVVFVAGPVMAQQRLAATGLSTATEDGVTCCFAVQDKVWVTGPDNAWEIYTVLADAPADAPSCDASTGCCA